MRERYVPARACSIHVAAIPDKMRAVIDELGLHKNAQTNEVPGCELSYLLAMIDVVLVKQDHSNIMRGIHDFAILAIMRYTFGRAIDTRCAWKQQLCIDFGEGDSSCVLQRSKRRLCGGYLFTRRPNTGSCV